MPVNTFGAPLAPAPIWWEPKYPSEVLDYEWTIPSTIVADPSTIQTLTVAAAPSGTGQLTLNSVDLVGPTVTLNESAGQPGTAYTLLFTADLSDGEVVQWLVQQQVLPYLSSYTAIVATSSDFGPPVSWSSAAVFALNGGFVVFSTNVSFPTSAPSWAGAAWDNGGFLSGVPGITPSPTAPPQFFASINPSFLLWYGVGSLPTADPHVVDQLWLNGGFVCRSAG